MLHVLTSFTHNPSANAAFLLFLSYFQINVLGCLCNYFFQAWALRILINILFGRMGLLWAVFGRFWRFSDIFWYRFLIWGWIWANEVLFCLLVLVRDALFDDELKTFVYPITRFGGGLSVLNPEVGRVLLGFLGGDCPIEIQVSFGTDEYHGHVCLSVLVDSWKPTLHMVERCPVSQIKYDNNCVISLVESVRQGPESLHASRIPYLDREFLPVELLLLGHKPLGTKVDAHGRRVLTMEGIFNISLDQSSFAYVGITQQYYRTCF